MTESDPIGYVNFDSTSSSSNELEIRVPAEHLQGIRRGQYIRIASSINGQKVNFFSRISRGPFFVPDAVSKDSAFARAAILHAGEIKFRPDFHGLCYAELVGQLNLDEMKTYGTFIRPGPQAAVYPLTGVEIERLLELSGDMYLGVLDGYPDVRVRIPSNKNAALPRNIGIFGTVGSGKTNTSQVLIEEAASHNWAVVVLDVEGEYVNMSNPSRQRSLESVFKRFGIEPKGVENLHVYHPIGTEPASPNSTPFGIRFSRFQPEVIAEILGLTQPQADRFFETWHFLAARSTSTQKGSRTSAGFVRSMMQSFEGGPAIGVTLADVLEQLDTLLEDTEHTKGVNRTSFYVLRRRLRTLERYQIFDTKNNLGDYSDLVSANRVSVIDLSGSSNVEINNLIIFDLLKGIFGLKLNDRDGVLPPTMVAIEEAHTFVSRENVGRMEETLNVLREISRRGRKRWMSLCFISQQPSHLPQEIYELCNTKFAHQTTGGKNLDAIKGATGGVDPGVWDDVPRLGQGTCLFVSSFFKNRPMFINMRPAASERRMVEE
ncbi:MAG: ATP-binding protein [Thermoplasmataceae archaeon]